MSFPRVFFAICISFHFGLTFAQQSTTCEQILNSASAEFDAGRFYSLPAMLRSCLDGGFTSEQRFRAYYLLTQAYLVLNDPLAAENAYLKLLQVDPEFQASVYKDPVDLYLLSKKFTSRPRFTPNYRAGINVSFPSVLANTSTNSSNTTTNYGLRIGYQLGAGLDFNMNDRWSVGTEVTIGNKTFSANSSPIFQNDDLFLTERATWVDIPVYVKYQIDSGRLRPFGYVGFALNTLLSSSGTLVFNDRSPSLGSSVVRVAQGTDISFTNSRYSLNRSIVIGGGVKYKLKKNFLFIDLRYMIGLNNIVKPSEAYYNSDGSLATSVTQYAYVSPLYRIENLSLSAGYIMPIYQPRKIKKLSSKGWFKKKKEK